ncbi:MAG TPA: glycine cleavage system aminomethyltransferase GcvT [Acidimicrobiales bacterium]|nr:glycine cleavage system aminomethyltransferase GcvT [Acidimicrobiales bacterium]
MERSSPLEALHAELGATFTQFAGWRMPLRYGSETAEHLAVRERAGLFDLSHMGELAVSGPAAGAALDRALVSRLSDLRVGRARYTMACDERGGVIDDLVAYRTGEEAYLLVVNAANTSAALDAVAAQVRGLDAQVADVSGRFALVAIQGPSASELLAPRCDADLGALPSYAATQALVAGHPGLVARTGYTGEDGFELFVAPEDARAVFEALLEAGALPAGLAARDTLRLEAGMPLYGHELDRDHTPFEAGLGRVVRLDKPGDFAGRAALEVAAARPPARRLAGLASLGRRVLRQGCPVVELAQGRSVGTVTSGAYSPTLRRPIAMAYVEADALDAGLQLGVALRSGVEAVEVVPLPFYRRAR